MSELAIWVLLILAEADDDTLALSSTEFRGVEACEHAQEMMSDSRLRIASRTSYVHVYAVCVPKHIPRTKDAP